MLRILKDLVIIIIASYFFAACKKEETIKEEEIMEIALIHPANGSSVFFEELAFEWNSRDTSCQQIIYISEDSSFINIADSFNSKDGIYLPSDFECYVWNSVYYWRITATCDNHLISHSSTFTFFLIDTRDSIIGNYIAKTKREWHSTIGGFPTSGIDENDSVPISILKDSLTGLIINYNFSPNGYPDNIFPLIADSGTMLYGYYSYFLCRYIIATNQIIITDFYSGDHMHYSNDSVFIQK